MKSLKAILISATAALSLALAACGGGGGSSPTQPITVTLAGAPTSLTVGGTSAISATVGNDPSNAGVTWSVTCGSTSCGSFNPTSTQSGSPTTFQAPAAVPTGNTVTVVATSVTDTTKTATATITINAAAGISVSFSTPPPAMVVINSSTSITANVTGDTKNGGVTWAVTCGGTVCGSFAPTSTASGSATVYTAPAAIPSGNTVTIKATSVTDATKSASATISIATPAVADGTYIFNINGQNFFSSNGQTLVGPYYAAGAFQVTNGVIVGGELDYNAQSGVGTDDSLNPAGSSITTSDKGNLIITLATADTGIGVNGVITLRGAQVSATRSLLTEFDDFAAAGGTLDLQTSQAPLTQGYAFNLGGVDSSQTTQVMGGILTFASNGTLATSTSVFDINDGGTVEQSQPFTSGSVTAPDSFGRVSITLTPGSGTGVSDLVLAGYITTASKVALIETLDPLDAVMGGVALGQGTQTGTFTAGAVQGGAYVFTGFGADSNPKGVGVATFGGSFALGSGGIATGDIAINDLNCCGDDTFTGTWTIAATGRVTVSITQTSGSGNGPFTFQLYLDGNGNALELGTDTQEASAGLAYLQTGNVNGGNYALGANGVENNSALTQFSAAGPVTLSGANLSGTTDFNSMSLSAPVADAALTGTINTTTGAINVTGLDAAGTTDSYGYWPIDGNRIIAIELDSNQLGMLQMEIVTP